MARLEYEKDQEKFKRASMRRRVRQAKTGPMHSRTVRGRTIQLHKSQTRATRDGLWKARWMWPPDPFGSRELTKLRIDGLLQLAQGSNFLDFQAVVQRATLPPDLKERACLVLALAVDVEATHSSGLATRAPGTARYSGHIHTFPAPRRPDKLLKAPKRRETASKGLRSEP